MRTRGNSRTVRTVGVLATLFVAAALAIAAAPPGGAGETAAEDLELTGLAAAPRPALGPLHGLGALIEHVAIGDPEGTLEPGARSAEVALAQIRLADLGFRSGPIDGIYGGQTLSAVLALQKHEGLPRTGIVDPGTRAAMQGLDAPSQREDLLGDRIEIDLTRQLIFLVVDGEVSIINTSTGNDETFEQQDGSLAVARTPRGDFRVGQQFDGVQEAFLGTLYRPMYFVGPYAIHGSGSVPGYPASHGCARTSFGDMDFLWSVVPRGMQVYTYD